MKKFFLSFALITFSLFGNMMETNAFLDDLVTGISAVGDTVNSVQSLSSSSTDNPLGSVSSVVNDIDSFVNDISGITNDVGGIVNLGVGIVSDFEDIWDTVEGGGVGPDGKFVLPDSEEFNEIGENTSLREYILNVLNFVLSFLGLVAVMAIIYAGFKYVTALGDDGAIEASKKIVIYAVVGILIILMSFALVNTVINNAGTGGDDRDTVVNNLNTQNVTNSENNFISTMIDPDDNNTVSSSLFNFQNGIKLSGNSATTEDFGSTAITSVEDALAGLTFGLTLQSNAVFDFGDGTQGLIDTITNPSATLTHSFGEEKSYNVRAIAQSADGSFYTFEKTIVVGGTNATFTTSKDSAVIDEKITLDASQTSTSIGSIKNYIWSCSGGTGCFPETNDKTISASFSQPGNYTVTLVVENTLGTTDEATKDIVILSDKPTAEYTFNTGTNSQKPMLVIFDARQSKNLFGENSSLLYQWNFDGIIKESFTSTYSYEFPTEGFKNVELIVIQTLDGKQFSSDKFSQNIEITATLPVEFNVYQ